MSRKLLFVLTLLATISTSSLVAQSRFELDLNDGLNFSSLIGIDNTTPKAGLYTGVSATYYFTPNWGASVGVAYSEQGAHCNANDKGVEMTYNYNYLNIPVLATFRLPEYNLSFLAGVQVGRFLDANYDYTAPSVTKPNQMVNGSSTMSEEQFHPWEVGATLGARWLFLPKWNVGFEARYTMGITQTHNGISNSFDGDLYISVVDNRNSTISAGLYWCF